MVKPLMGARSDSSAVNSELTGLGCSNAGRALGNKWLWSPGPMSLDDAVPGRRLCWKGPEACLQVWMAWSPAPEPLGGGRTQRESRRDAF